MKDNLWLQFLQDLSKIEIVIMAISRYNCALYDHIKIKQTLLT